MVTRAPDQALDYPHHHSNVPCPTPRRTEQVQMSIASLLRRRIDSFEAISNFTRVTARWIAQPL